MGLNLALLRGSESVLLVVQIWVVEMSFSSLDLMLV